MPVNCICEHRNSSSLQHWLQAPHDENSADTPTRVPGLSPVTSFPISSMTPAISWPGTIGYCAKGKCPNWSIRCRGILRTRELEEAPHPVLALDGHALQNGH